MYSSPNFQISNLINNSLEVIKDDTGIDMGIATQHETSLYTENKRISFYTCYNRGGQ